MSWSVKAFLYAGPWLPHFAMKKIMDWEMGGNAARNPDKKAFEEMFMKVMEKKTAKDRACLEDVEFRDIMIESMRESFRQGSDGPAWDGKLYADWGFKLEEAEGDNITLWHAKGDANAPFQMAEKAAKLIKGCVFKAIEDETHASLPYNYMKEVVASLLRL